MRRERTVSKLRTAPACSTPACSIFCFLRREKERGKREKEKERERERKREKERQTSTINFHLSIEKSN